MNPTLSIDITRLEKLRQRGDKIVAACPACRSAGNDRKGDHFFLNSSTGQWGCGCHPGDREHRQQIKALIGIKPDRPPDPALARQQRQNAAVARQEAEARERLTQAARASRAALVARWRWDEADLWENSPQKIDQELVASDPRWLLQSLFPPAATIWTGEVFQSGRNHAGRWRTVAEWQKASAKEVGPMVAPCTWKPGTVSRTGGNVQAEPFCVLDFDELDGVKPSTPEELEEHLAAARAITRWLAEGMGWRLAAIIHTGGKSLHGWFHNPGPAALASLRAAAAPLGIDAGLIGHPEHPARLPGQIHRKTNQRSRVLWI